MAGVFNIIPKGGSTITCAFGDNESIDYNIVAADFNEAEREEVLYSKGKLGGSVAGINHGIVEITLLFAVGGTSENDAATNARTLNNALRNREGGLIEYRPREYDSTVTNTFYRYLKAGASRRISKKTLIPTERHVAGELHEFTVTTFAWATSNPNSFSTIVAETGIFNHDDGAHDNYVDILGSDIIGDVFFPIIKFELDAATDWSSSLIVHKRPMIIGAHTNLDWWEAEDLDIPAAVPIALAAASNGQYMLVGTFPTFGGTGDTFDWNSKYMGNISPIICARRQPSGTGVFDIHISVFTASTGTELTQTSILDTSVWDTFDSWGVIYQFPELVVPPYKIQQHITDTSTPNVVTYTGGLRWRIYVDRLSGTGNLWLDWVLLARSDDWLSIFDSGPSFIEGKALKGDGSTYLEVDAISNTSHLKATSDDAVILSWVGKGSPISSLSFGAGEDSRVRFIAPGGFTASAYSALWEALVTITGVHATIYPFET